MKTLIALFLLALTACGGAMRTAEAGETVTITVDISFGTPPVGCAAWTTPSDSASVHATIVILSTAWADPYAPSGQDAALLAHEISHLLWLQHSTDTNCVCHPLITSPYPTSLCTAERSAASEKAAKYRFVIGTCPSGVAGPLAQAIAVWEGSFPGLFP